MHTIFNIEASPLKCGNFIMPDNKINGVQSMGELSWQNH